MNAGSFVHNTGELLAFLCLAGMVAVGFRWQRAARKDFLISFWLVLFGLFLREAVVWWYGVAAWPLEALLLSAVARLVTLVGAVLFVRASLRETCGEWGWMLVLSVAGLAAALV